MSKNKPLPSGVERYYVEPPKASREQLCSVFPADGVPLYGVGVGAQGRSPGEFKPELDWAFDKARWWKRFNWFVNSVLGIKQAFYTYGFKVSPATKGRSKEERGKDRSGFEKWWEANEDAVEAYAGDVWDEWVMTDNVISFWRDKSPRPIILAPENVEYSDLMGKETLRFKGRPDGVVWSKVPDSVKKIYEDRKVMTIAGRAGKFFKVLKREKLGWGLAWPGMTSVTTVCDQVQSMEVGDLLWAYMGRKPYEQHKMGHEIKSGPHAGYPTHFIKTAVANAFKKELQGKTGSSTLITNFDQSVDWYGPDPKQFDASKYKGAIDRLMMWSMPIGQMVMATGGVPNPLLLLILGSVAVKERKLVGRHLEYVINAAFEPPCRVKCSWSNKVFRDPRLAADLLKFGLKAGPVSQETFLEDSGFDADEERARKREEAKLPESHTHPLHDPDHGDKGMNGRKAGTADGEGKGKG